MRLVSALLILASCHPADLQETIEFYSLAKKHGCHPLPTKVYFQALSGDKAGLCHFGGIVLIDKKKWDSYLPYERRELVFHELGHCSLLKRHGGGIMSPKMHDESEIIESWDDWVRDLFRDCK